MGGLSAGELMQGPTLPRKEDFVENCLEKLSGKVRDRYGDNDDYEFEDDESGISSSSSCLHTNSPRLTTAKKMIEP